MVEKGNVFKSHNYLHIGNIMIVQVLWQSLNHRQFCCKSFSDFLISIFLPSNNIIKMKPTIIYRSRWHDSLIRVHLRV